MINIVLAGILMQAGIMLYIAIAIIVVCIACSRVYGHRAYRYAVKPAATTRQGRRVSFHGRMVRI
jgi:hypothetical protein